MHRILSGRIGSSRPFGKSASRRESPSFLASLVAVTNGTPTTIKPSSGAISKNVGASSEEKDQDGEAGESIRSTSSSLSVTTARPYTNRLINFYTHPNGSRDYEGRTLSDILRFPDYDLERYHDYIQWLFPLPERSPYNPDAPQIDQPTAEAFRTRLELRSRLHESLVRMLSFYGFEATQYSQTGRFKIQEASNIDFQRKSRFWLRRFDHNHLRITRIIRCLRVLGLEEEAAEFYKALVRVGTPGPEGRGGVSPMTLMFWKRAAKRPLEIPPEDEHYPDEEDEEDVGAGDANESNSDAERVKRGSGKEKKEG